MTRPAATVAPPTPRPPTRAAVALVSPVPGRAAVQIGPGQTIELAFGAPGIVGYVCDLHEGMVGALVVQP